MSAQPGQHAELARWEYRLLDMGDRLDVLHIVLNRLGEEGWDAISHTGRSILLQATTDRRR